MGLAYSVVQFRDVMIRSLKKPSKASVAWRHPNSFIPCQGTWLLELGTNHSDELRLLL